MVIKSLKLKNFRNYSEETFEFSDGVNIISGANAREKQIARKRFFIFARVILPAPDATNS